MLEALRVRPDWKLCLAQLSETLLKTYRFNPGVRISCGNGATNTGVAAFKGHFADTKANHAADFRAEKSVLPKSRDAVYFKGRTKAPAGFGNRHSGKPGAHGIK